ncbi:LacI family DNA-binding transcriptional regulator [Cutibacterium sp. V947]|uniref:LacI family DNA-binding transcriptional regulator n=1 Tax=Cutibacterium sp. V947 TaxID=3446480 RepID=UPI003EDF571B
MNKRVTSYDVAKLAGVSRSAVSVVLNGRADGIVSVKNQEAVRRAAQQLGYRPNRLARSLRNSTTHTVGVVTDSILSGAFGGAMISGATMRAAQEDYLLLVIGTENDRNQEKHAISALQDRQVDALIFAAEGLSPWSPPDSFRSECNILLNAIDPTHGTACVITDEVRGGYRAAKILIEAGHHNIAYLAGTPDLIATHRRLEGFNTAMAEAGIRPRVLTCGWEIDRGLETGAAVLASSGRPTGIMCANDRVAAGVFIAAARLGLQIPEDVSIVGYDDDPNVAPQLGLSTVGIPHWDMGAKAIDLLLEQLGGSQVDHDEVLVQGPVIKRSSVCSPVDHR